MSIDLNISYGDNTFDDTLSGNGNPRLTEDATDWGYDSHGNVIPLGSESSEERDGEPEQEANPRPTETVNGCGGGDGMEAECSSRGTGFVELDIGYGINSIDVLQTLLSKRLEVGSFVDTLDDVFDLYTEYARFNGFSARKGSQSYFLHTSIPKMKLYHCSCDGRPDNKASFRRVASYKKQSHRSNCKAKLRVRRADEDSPWKVTSLMKQHNHELLKHSESYLLRSARKMSDGKKRLIVGMKNSGIGVSAAFRFLENEAGGRENIGFTLKDVYNELDRESRRLCKVDNADANKLVEYLTEKGLSEPSFYWKVKLSDDCRLENLFYRDSRCLVDYQHFGDVISVDATYKMNKYDMMCVPIVGMNHHRTNVLFGIAFLSNERTESYQWLFRTFLEAMYQKEPCIVFSDQDQTLMNAVDLTFRQSSHRLCQWHINKNAVRHFGKLNCDNDFKRKWYTCMNGCENEEQFESTWSSMIVQHNLVQNKWFCTMYNLRRRWSSAFTRDKFSGGLHDTSRSESTNRALKELCKSTSTLHDFVVGFERMQKTWRTREFEEDALNRGRPGMFVQHTSILDQVGEICTRNIFKLFEYEAVNSITIDLTQEAVDVNNQILEFKLSSRTSITGFRVVKFYQLRDFGTCSCQLWETEGIMCRYLFKVYFHLNLHKIPDEMILSRWRKDSKQRLDLSHDSSGSECSNKLSNMVFVNHNTKVVYDMLTDCKDHSVCRDVINGYISKMLDAVKSLKLDSTRDTTDTSSQTGFKEPLVRRISNPNS